MDEPDRSDGPKRIAILFRVFGMLRVLGGNLHCRIQDKGSAGGRAPLQSAQHSHFRRDKGSCHAHSHGLRSRVKNASVGAMHQVPAFAQSRIRRRHTMRQRDRHRGLPRRAREPSVPAGHRKHWHTHGVPFSPTSKSPGKQIPGCPRGAAGYEEFSRECGLPISYMATRSWPEPRRTGRSKNL